MKTSLVDRLEELRKSRVAAIQAMKEETILYKERIPKGYYLASANTLNDLMLAIQEVLE